MQVTRAEIDLLRGDTDVATERLQLVRSLSAVVSRVDFAYESARRTAEAELWAGRPSAALHEVQRTLVLFKAPDLTIWCGRLLTAGMRACADLAERARARRDQPAAMAAVAAGDSLADWVRHMGGVPFADHPYGAVIPAERATWEGERTRLAGPGHPEAWSGAAQAWQDLGCPHRAGYAW